MEPGKGGRARDWERACGRKRAKFPHEHMC